jgi:hypothetical protein
MKKAGGMLVLFLTALLMIAGCSSASPAPTAMSADSILSRSYDAMQSAVSFHFIMDHNSGGTTISTGTVMTRIEGDIAKPDKMQATISGTAMGLSVEIQLVTVGGKMMMTNPLNGNWETPSSVFDVLNVFDPGKGVAAIIKGMANPSILEDENVESVPCYHLKGAVPSEEMKPITGTAVAGVNADVDVWIAKDSFQIQQIKVAGKIAAGDADGIVRTLTFNGYGKVIDIQLPK